jgi:urease accessory protein
MENTNSALLQLLQLASPALPVGAYSYSEGLEFLVDSDRLKDCKGLEQWLTQELVYGSVRLEAAVMVRSYHAVRAGDLDALNYWNSWLSATREAEELRSQSWQMGRSLLRLFADLETAQPIPPMLANLECNFAVAYGLVAASWQIDLRSALLGYLHSWVANLISAGVKLIPLGQTSGQQLLLSLNSVIYDAAEKILDLPDAELACCGWGLNLASMAHETQYSRLFRS